MADIFEPLLTVNIRMERDASQKFARIMYFTVGLMVFVYPPDLSFGREFIEYYDYTNTAIKGFLTFTTLWFIKGLTSSRTSTKMWVEFYNDLLKNSSKELTQKIQKTLADYFKDKYAVPLIPKTLKMEMMLRDSLRNILGKSSALKKVS